MATATASPAKGPPKDDGEYIYRKSFRHAHTGRRIVAPPGKCFRFRVKR